MCDTWVRVRVTWGVGVGVGRRRRAKGVGAFGHSAVITTAPPYYIIMLGKSKTYRFFYRNRLTSPAGRRIMYVMT